MIDFAVIGLPRTGTAWASNWLDCPHEPALESLGAFAAPGFTSTAAWLQPQFIYENVRRWVVLERDPDEVDLQADQLGYPRLSPAALDVFYAMRGPRMPWTALFDPDTAADIWGYLRPEALFDTERHARLRTLNIETRLRYD